MKRLTYLPALLVGAIALISSCSSNRERGRTYMPDMANSRALESYAELDSTVFTTDATNKGGKIYFNAAPAAGTIKRGELYPYTLPHDSVGYKMSASVKNPFDSLSKADMAEAGRLFNINCAICHGPKAMADGPLAAPGKVGGIANLTQPTYVSMADGTMFHSITYGKNNMGSYASQLTRQQRWMIVKY